MAKLGHILSQHVYDLVGRALTVSPYNYFEIGVFNGAGFAMTAEVFPDTQCYAVDPFIEDGNTIAVSRVSPGTDMQSQKDSAFAHIKDYPNASITVATSHAFKEALTQEQIDKLNIGTVLIDGNHAYEFVVNDYQLSLQLIGNKEGYVIFDDTNMPSVKRAFEEFESANADRIISTDSNGPGILVKLRAI